MFRVWPKKCISPMFSSIVLCFSSNFEKENNNNKLWHAFSVLGVTLGVSVWSPHTLITLSPNYSMLETDPETSPVNSSHTPPHCIPYIVIFLFMVCISPRQKPEIYFPILLCSRGMVMWLRLSQSEAPSWDMDSGAPIRTGHSTRFI